MKGRIPARRTCGEIMLFFGRFESCWDIAGLVRTICVVPCRHFSEILFLSGLFLLMVRFVCRYCGVQKTQQHHCIDATTEKLSVKNYQSEMCCNACRLSNKKLIEEDKRGFASKDRVEEPQTEDARAPESDVTKWRKEVRFRNHPALTIS